MDLAQIYVFNNHFPLYVSVLTFIFLCMQWCPELTERFAPDPMYHEWAFYDCERNQESLHYSAHTQGNKLNCQADRIFHEIMMTHRVVYFVFWKKVQLPSNFTKVGSLIFCSIFPFTHEARTAELADVERNPLLHLCAHINERLAWSSDAASDT